MKERKVRWALETAESFLADAIRIHRETKKDEEDLEARKEIARNNYFLARCWLVEAKRRMQ